jgi:hypothetical protein
VCQVTAIFGQSHRLLYLDRVTAQAICTCTYPHPETTLTGHIITTKNPIVERFSRLHRTYCTTTIMGRGRKTGSKLTDKLKQNIATARRQTEQGKKKTRRQISIVSRDLSLLKRKQRQQKLKIQLQLLVAKKMKRLHQIWSIKKKRHSQLCREEHMNHNRLCQTWMFLTTKTSTMMMIFQMGILLLIA